MVSLGVINGDMLYSNYVKDGIGGLVKLRLSVCGAIVIYQLS